MICQSSNIRDMGRHGYCSRKQPNSRLGCSALTYLTGKAYYIQGPVNSYNTTRARQGHGNRNQFALFVLILPYSIRSTLDLKSGSKHPSSLPNSTPTPAPECSTSLLSLINSLFTRGLREPPCATAVDQKANQSQDSNTCHYNNHDRRFIEV